MGQLELMPPTNVLSLRVARAWKGEAHRGAASPNGRTLGATEAGLPLTPQRLELVKAYANRDLRSAQAPTASHIAQRFAPRAEAAPLASHPQPASHASLTAPFSTLASGFRRLTVVVVVVALLPNLTLAAFWLRLIDAPWSQPVALPPSKSPIPAVQFETALPVLSAPAMIETAAGKDAILPIALDGTDGVPPGSVIVIGGLPRGSTLSNGRPRGETGWTLKPDEIGDLHLVPVGAESSESMLTIQLLAPNNGILADATSILKVMADPTAAIPADAIPTAPPAEAQSFYTPSEGLEVASVAESRVNLDDAAAMSEVVPLPTRRPSPSASDDGHTSWIKPSAYVNLRERPSSSARVVSVVAKGAKLRVIGRNRGWIQVTNPATSHSGWIYSGNVETVP
jgi:Bacterial SH3 domain